MSTVKLHNFAEEKDPVVRGSPPPPIILERLKLPQQITYHRKSNVSESPNQFRYRKNILISRFYKRFSRNGQNLGHFGSSKKFQTLRT